MAANPPAARAGANATRTCWFTTKSSSAICTKVATVDKAAPATALPMFVGRSAAHPAIDPMVAVLEMKPEAKPAIGKP